MFPLVIYSHGGADSRFSAGFLATHLASHGHVVAAADHPDDNKVVLPGEERHDAFVEQLRADGAFVPGLDVEVMLQTVGRHEDMLATDKAHAVLQALLLAHMDAHLKGRGDAAGYLGSGLEDRIADHGVEITAA